MNRTIETAYSRSHDITFIMEYLELDDGRPVQTSVVGFYYGEPNEEDNAYFYGKLTAIF